MEASVMIVTVADTLLYWDKPKPGTKDSPIHLGGQS